LTILLSVTVGSMFLSILLWRRQKKREYATLVDRRMLAISARAQNENPHFESYR
jgi:hypothetical protein